MPVGPAAEGVGVITGIAGRGLVGSSGRSIGLSLSFVLDSMYYACCIIVILSWII